MNAEFLDAVVMKLNGPIDPVGESNIDSERLENLNRLCTLTDTLLNHIVAVAGTTGEHMASIKAAKNVASAFLQTIPAERTA